MRNAALFIFLAFGLDWGLVALYRGLGGRFEGPEAFLFGVVYMLGPAAAALIVQYRTGEPALAPLGLRFRWSRWLVAAWLLPPLLAVVAAATALLLPGVVFSPGMEGMADRLADLLNPEQMEAMHEQTRNLPVHPFWLVLGQALVAGATVNAVAALGEELGWRGFLQRELGHLGFWRSSALVGVIWGVWHAPLILQGHNYPDHPGWGAGMMVLFTVLASPLLSYVRLRSRTVLAAAVFHGTLNASWALSVMLLAGGSDLVVGLTGAAGLSVLAVANAVLWWATRRGWLRPVQGRPRDDEA